MKPDVTGLLNQWSQGSLAAGDEVAALIYSELRKQAKACLRREPRPGALQPTELVDEAFVRLVKQKRVVWQNRGHFLAVAAHIMRRILVDGARRERMAKRAGRWRRVTLTNLLAPTGPDVNVLDLDAALTRLSEFDPRKSRIAELRFFAGLTLQETSDVLGLSIATVERDWQAARAWLHAALKGTPIGDAGTLAPNH